MKLIDDWKERLMTHDWPECGPGAVEIEALYQSFKARLIQELQVTNAGQRIGSLDNSPEFSEDAPT